MSIGCLTGARDIGDVPCEGDCFRDISQCLCLARGSDAFGLSAPFSYPSCLVGENLPHT